MRVIISGNYDQLSQRSAQVVAELVRRKPDCVLGLATGSTPIGLYQELVRLSWEEELDFSGVTTFNLDEYIGLPSDHEQSYRSFMEKNLFEWLRRRPAQTHVPDGMVNATSVTAYCTEYEERIRECGGIDLQVLGIGGDGHIGFNEPGSSLASRTRAVVLDSETIQDNARFFSSPEQVPRFAITMGVGTILESRHCLLLASGIQKAKVVAQAIEGPLTAQITASALQMHPDAIAVLDEDAAELLERTEYYRHCEQAMVEFHADGCGHPLPAGKTVESKKEARLS